MHIQNQDAERYQNTKPHIYQSPRKPRDQKQRRGKIFDIRERALYFSLRVIEISEALPKNMTYDIIRKQLIKSGTSIGANIEEADGGVSKRDFINKAAIARKEARETKYWLRIINMRETEIELDKEIQEVQEIINILSTMIKNTKEPLEKK